MVMATIEVVSLEVVVLSKLDFRLITSLRENVYSVSACEEVHSQRKG